MLKLFDSCVLLTLRIGQNVNTLWNNPIQVCIAYFNTPPCYAYHTLPIATVMVVSGCVINYVITYFNMFRLMLSLYAKVWFSFRVLANLAGKTHKSASNLVQIEQIPRYHPHTPKTPQSFIFEAIQTSASHGGNPESYLPCLKLLFRILETRFNFT